MAQYEFPDITGATDVWLEHYIEGALITTEEAREQVARGEAWIDYLEAEQQRRIRSKSIFVFAEGVV